MSVTFKPFVTASARTPMSSAALRPTIEPPRTTPVAGSDTIFTNPRGSPLMSAFAFELNGTLVDADLAARSEGLRFGEPDVRDLGFGEHRGRRLLVVEVAMRSVVHPHQVLGDLAALHRGHRRQRQLPGDVADRVDVGDVRQAVVVHDDEPGLVALHTRGVEPEVLGVGDRSDGQHGMRRVDDTPVLTHHAHTVVGAVDAARARPLRRLMPRSRNADSSTAATSASLIGSTC